MKKKVKPIATYN